MMQDCTSTKKGCSLEGLPPTHEALLQHIRRAVFQGCYVWGNLGVAMQELPPPEQWGWKLEDKTFHPLWTTLQEAAKFCYELIHCKCKTTDAASVFKLRCSVQLYMPVMENATEINYYIIT